MRTADTSVGWTLVVVLESVVAASDPPSPPQPANVTAITNTANVVANARTMGRLVSSGGIGRENLIEEIKLRSRAALMALVQPARL